MKSFVIAANTFRETIRNRIMYNILFFAIFVIGVSLLVSDWSIHQQAKILKDFGLAAMSIFGLLIAIFIGIRLIYQEIEKRTIYMLVTKPIARWEIIVGKYLGLILTIAVNVLVMSLCLFAVDYLLEGFVNWELTPAILLIYVEIMVVIALATFFSTFTSPMISALLTICLFVVGHLSPILKLFLHTHTNTIFKLILQGIYYTVPNLEYFNIRTAVVESLPLPHHFLFYALFYGIGYVGILLLISSFIFRRKDLK
ncbi:hypothetical protein B5M50_01525 [candidate division KSB1 bacterium 4484_219]|nr:MAG: hypothetical protein B5M50_01525 [candidate division KSB1 bacterium 4484_219]HDI51499.1 ABC transporter permease [Bacteroidota bacterium]